MPLPDDVRIIPPGPQVPRDLAALSGQWAGTLEMAAGKYLPHVLVVEQVDETGAALIIATPVQWVRFGHAAFSQGALTADWVEYGGAMSIQYRLASDGTVFVEAAQNDQIFRGRLKRVR